jgi:hypothetical protein
LLRGGGCDETGAGYEKVQNFYFLIGKRDEETGAAYLLIGISYEQIEKIHEQRVP